MPTPENTTQRDPSMHLLGAIGGGLSGYIEDMEATGQRQIVHSDTLPAEAPWDDLEALGFKPGDAVPDDDLFRRCTLPDGWKREGSNHATWSYIVDERGIKRVAIFYKAAFYDRHAFARIENPGAWFATYAIYGEGKSALPEEWPILTDGERDAFRASLAAYLKDAEKCPSVYGDRAPRVRMLARLAAT